MANHEGGKRALRFSVQPEPRPIRAAFRLERATVGVDIDRTEKAPLLLAGRSWRAMPIDRLAERAAFVWYSGNTTTNELGSLKGDSENACRREIVV
jgi:hypothetical protein